VWQVNDYHRLGLTEWLTVIDAIHTDLAGAQEREENTIADVLQLRGLCERLESEKFQPISEEELSPKIGLRITQYRDIIDTVVERLGHAGDADTERLRPTTAGFSWGRSFRLHSNVCDLVFLPDAWARHREAQTPLWLVVRNHDNRVTEELRNALSQLAHENPPRLIDDGRQLLVPIFILTDVERDKVISDIERQLRNVTALLPRPPRKGSAGP
jgi:hypothetical protein